MTWFGGEVIYLMCKRCIQLHYDIFDIMNSFIWQVQWSKKFHLMSCMNTDRMHFTNCIRLTFQWSMLSQIISHALSMHLHTIINLQQKYGNVIPWFTTLHTMACTWYNDIGTLCSISLTRSCMHDFYLCMILPWSWVINVWHYMLWFLWMCFNFYFNFLLFFLFFSVCYSSTAACGIVDVDK